MAQEKRSVKMTISIDIKTNKTIEEIRRSLERGIYRGLDTEPYNIAPPSDVKINFVEESI